MVTFKVDYPVVLTLKDDETINLSKSLLLRKEWDFLVEKRSGHFHMSDIFPNVLGTDGLNEALYNFGASSYL